MLPPTALFISCVSNEFASYRPVLWDELTFPGVEVHGENRFDRLPQGEPVLLELDLYIRGCNVVVHLVGDQCGQKASDANLASILNEYPDLPVEVGLEREILEELSYTQWEAVLAIRYGKKLVIAVPSEAAPRDNPPEEATAPDQKTRQTAHLEWLKTRGHHDSITFAGPEDFAVPLLRYLYHLLRSSLSEETLLAMVKDRRRLASRFGPGMVNKLKARLTNHVEKSAGARDLILPAVVQITGLLPNFQDPDKNTISVTIDELAERTSELDLPALVLRILWSVADSQSPTALALQAWLDEVLPHCKSDIESLEGHLADSENGWPRKSRRPPLPLIEIGWTPSPADPEKVNRMAFVRWGRCRAALPCIHHTQGLMETTVCESMDAVEDGQASRVWPVERVEVFVDKEQLNYRWEFRDIRTTPSHLHPWPVVVRLNRKPFQRRVLPGMPAILSKHHFACALDKDAAFAPPPRDTGAFFLSLGCCGAGLDELLGLAVEVAGIGLWTRQAYVEEVVTTLLDTLDEVPLEDLPQWAHRHRDASGMPGIRDIALLYDDRSLPPFESAAGYYGAEHQRRAVMRL